MAYETGGASGVFDLMEKLRVFAIAQGWTVENVVTFGTDTAAIAIAKAGRFFSFHTQLTNGNSDDPLNRFGAQVRAQAFTSTSGAAVQPNTGPVCWSNNMPGPFQAYHFFAGNNMHGEAYIHIVVEAFPGSFRHIGIGTINRMGAVSTGDYSFGSRWNYWSAVVNTPGQSYHASPFDQRISSGFNPGTIVRCDSDGVSPRYGSFCDSTGGAYPQIRGGFVDDNGLIDGLAYGPSNLTGRAIMAPLLGAIQRPSGFYSMLGAPADMRFVDLTNYEPGDLITLGPDTWKVFPVIRKNGAAGRENSGVFGYAYRVVA